MLACLGGCFSMVAQPFINEIKEFTRQDAGQMPPTGQILFTGSSSFRLWKDMQLYFPGKPILNRGFGGASLTDVIYYADEVIFKYQPGKIVLYCGENDLAASSTITADTVVARFVQLFELVRDRMPQVPIVYVSIKPSPSRRSLMPAMLQANTKIRQFLQQQKKTRYVDVYHKMLDATGNPLTHIFTSDSLHMNGDGYKIWQKALKRYL